MTYDLAMPRGLMISLQTGKTAVHYAAGKGRNGLVAFFIKKGADINTVDKVRCAFRVCGL